MKLVLAEVITIGDEILIGQITDTNTQWISAELDKIGIKTIRKTSVGDNKNEILSVLAEAEKRADVIIMTGGLGPTKDDITKKTLCEYFEDELVINQDALAFVTEFFEKRNRPMLEINRQQAAIPSRCTYLPNKVGTAPGMWFEKNRRVFVSMAGVPNEMKYLMNHEVLPKLKTFFETPALVHQTIRTIGIGESFLADKISTWEDNLPQHIKLAYLPSFGEVRLRLSGIGESEETLKAEINSEVQKLVPLIEEYIYSYEDEDLERAIGRVLKSKNLTVSVAESCTGGFLSHLFTRVAGSSAYFMGSVISYSNEAKMKVLGVQEATLEEHGAVSEETVKEMADGARKLLGTDFALATSGVAGPDGGSPEKPVGTIWIACSSKNQTIARKLLLTNMRENNINWGSYAALDLLRRTIYKEFHQ